MFKCKHCGYKFEYTGNECPVCGSQPIINKSDMDLAESELEVALRNKNVGKIRVCRKLLADGGDTASRREYAKLLERGDRQLRDTETAMDYYYLAAKENDGYSAYRYSRLIKRTSEASGSFWLRFAAVLGAIESYPDIAQYFSAKEREDIASYYYSLAAACDDTDSIVTMAKRYYEGIGVEKSEAHTKWYLDKLSILPMNAIKLAYQLRSVRAAEPPKIVFPDYIGYIRSLCSDAGKFGFLTAEFYLTSFLADNGDVNAGARLGIMLAEGKGCERNLSRAKECLDLSIAAGNPAAAVYMGEELMDGGIFEKNPDEAMKYFEKAAKLGYTNAYENLGDIYHDGVYAEKDIPKALEFYELAAHGGSDSAKEKCKKIKAVRERFYLDAHNIINAKNAGENKKASDGFKYAAIASAMGDARGMLLLAECYLNGTGVKKDRKSAFSWFKNAADAGLPDAMYCLGLCYAKGIGTNFSYKEALKAFKYAQNASVPGASEELDKLYIRRTTKMVRSLYSSAMTLIFNKKYAAAARLLLSFSSLEYPKAIYTLGCLYEFGKGVPNDRERAIRYYEKAGKGNPSFGSFKDPGSKYKLQILKMIR